MPYKISWHIPDEVVYIHYSGIVSVDELRSSLQEAYDYMESSPRHLVHTISDVGDVVTPTTIKDSMNIIREGFDEHHSGSRQPPAYWLDSQHPGEISAGQNGFCDGVFHLWPTLPRL